MARTAKDVTDAELAVLEVLWQKGRSPIRDLTEALYPGRSAAELATVQKLLERLLDKGFVARDRRQRPQLFAAAIDRQELIGRQLESVADKLCAGSYTPLLSHLVGGRALSPEEASKLAELVEQLERGTRGSRQTGQRRGKT